MDNKNFYCTVPLCNKKAIFGYKKIPERCKNHAKSYDRKICNPNFLNIKKHHTRCLLCANYATHGNIFSRIAQHCYRHATFNEVDVLKYRCNEKNCLNPATYDYIILLDMISDFRRCFEHKMIDQVNLRKAGVCTFPGCNSKNICYGYMEPYHLQLRCISHKLIGQIIVIKNTKCIFDDECKNTPMYGYLSSNERTHCEVHRLPNQYDLRTTKKYINKYC
ncbi:uncharacterized protein LOC136078891 [Hydra vulgaris]|uniref:Uncharacterized protein LOC136078891 n=1 Tax=Hydra vulgaris TaxID=6087 RepID=A0ABM4BNU1_HYDVU